MKDVVGRFEAKVGPLRKGEGLGGEWSVVWSAGDPSFELLNTEEANETGGLSQETLRERGWPTQDGTALLDYVPVLDVVARLSDAEGEALLDGGFPDSLCSVLAALPCSAHLVRESLYVSWAQGEDWIHAEVTPRQDDYGPFVSFVLMVLWTDEGVAAGIFGEASTEELAELFGVPQEELDEAQRESTEVYRDW